MKEKEMQKLSVEEIMNKIKQEVEKRKTSLGTGPNDLTDHIKTSSDTFDLQNNIVNVINQNTMAFVQKDIYEYADFTQYHDLEFITNVYRGILKREPDSTGGHHYLSLLRSGQKSKSEIISILRYSKEGRQTNVKLLGSKKRYLIAAVYSLPLIGYLSKLAVTLLTLPKLLKRLNSYESFIYQLHQISLDNDLKLQNVLNTKSDIKNIENLYSFIQSKADKAELEYKADKTDLDFKADRFELELKADKVELNSKVNKADLESKADKTDLDLKANRSELELKADKVVLDNAEKDKLDNFYVAFEDKFRGSRDDIKERLKVYLPYVEELPFEKEDLNVLDVGCGRGEWLEVLQDNDYNNVKGIDLNPIMVAKSKEFGLNAVQSDVMEYLKTQQDESLSLITGFHIIEHLPFEVLMKLFEESFRVLKKDGIIIFETPNPENITVGAFSFYTDPTHRNPLVPGTIEFIATQTGFNDIEIKRLHKYSDYFKTNEESTFIANHFYNEMDYSIIGYKK